MQSYSSKSHTVYKALERPALYFGLPIPMFFIVTAVPFLLGVYISLLLWISIPPIVFFLGLLSRKDPHIYNLLFLKFRTLGNRKANIYYGANAIFSQKYDEVRMFSLGKKDDESQ